MANSTATDAASTRGHPKGLYLLFTTEMWERLSYYGMRALLVLYMVDATKGGFGWTQAKALQIYGLYTGLVYLTPVIGGWLADQYLGQRRSIIIGGILMMFGQFALAMPGELFFYLGLLLLVVGNGFFKPNISTMVGGLYAPGDPRRDGAFTIFYMGINLGALLSSFVCGTLGERYGWSWGFGSAGVGMALGVIVFLAFEQAGCLMNIYTNDKVDRVVFGWEVPTTWFQAVNPLFIWVLGPVFAELWTSLGRRRKDPSIPAKMALGLLLLSFGFVFMLGASKQSVAEGKAALMWVVAAYFFHTAGELCLSPVGLSMVTKLAPARLVSAMMGVWFLSNAVANYLAGYIGGFAESLGEFDLFLAIAVATAAAGVVLLGIAPVLKRMMHGADETRPVEESPAPAVAST